MLSISCYGNLTLYIPSKLFAPYFAHRRRILLGDGWVLLASASINTILISCMKASMHPVMQLGIAIDVGNGK